MLSNKKGFTLIELLIVVVIIGILAAIAIPKFSNTKEKAYVATLKADLRNLVTAQESYFADFRTYRTGVFENTQFQASAGVTYAQTASASTFTATATHSALPAGRTCTITVGVAGTADGEPICQ